MARAVSMSLIEAVQHIQSARGLTEAEAKAELLRRLRREEIFARVERISVQGVHVPDAIYGADRKHVSVLSRTMMEVDGIFWRDPKVPIETCLDWRRDRIEFKSDGFDRKDFGAFHLVADGFLLRSDAVRDLWRNELPDLRGILLSSPRSKAHRPKGTGYEHSDLLIVEKALGLLDAGHASSATDAVRQVVGLDASGAKGSGTPESKVTRLVRLLKKIQRSRK